MFVALRGPLVALTGPSLDSGGAKLVRCAGPPWYGLRFGSSLGEALGTEGCQGAVWAQEGGVSFIWALAR